MNNYKEKIFTISKYNVLDDIPYYKFKEDSANYSWDEDWLTLVVDNVQTWDDFKKICKKYTAEARKKSKENAISYWGYTDQGLLVLANRETKVVGEARCKKNEKWDFDIGLGLAYARSIGIEIPKPPKYKKVCIATLDIGDTFQLAPNDELETVFEVNAIDTFKGDIICRDVDCEGYEGYDKDTMVYIKV